jgi:BolA protein
MSRQQRIEEHLRSGFAPVYLEVLNESHNHSAGSETHYKLVVVSEGFSGLRPVARHQKVYALMANEMAGGLHALALHLYTPEEWAAAAVAPDSPACRGGSKRG